MKIENNNIIIVSLSLSLFLIWGGFYLSYPNFFELEKRVKKMAEQKIEEQKKINKALAFDHLKLEAKAFVVYDIEVGKLIAGQQEHQPLSLASITKLMTVLIASENLESRTPITINQTTIETEGGLRQGERWFLANLAALTLVSSSNDGATALAESATTETGQNDFIKQMNEKSLALGLGDLFFTNPTGLDNNSVLGGRGSALSVAKLLAYIMKNEPEIFSATRESVLEEKSLDNLNHLVLNTNEVVNEIPGLIASKTGYTDVAGGNLAIVANLGLHRPVAIVVLGSSKPGRFADTKKLVGATLNYYTNLNSAIAE